MTKIFESRITAKGQTTIPVEIRQHLKVEPGDTIQFVLVDGHYEIVPRNRPATGLFGRLQDYAIPGTSVKSYREAVNEFFADADADRDGEGEAA